MGKEGGRKGARQERRETGKEGDKKGGMQERKDEERRDAGKERCR